MKFHPTQVSDAGPAQVSDAGPAQDVAPLTFYHDGIYVSGDLWGFWRRTFPEGSACDMFDFVKYDIDDEHDFTHSLACCRPPPLA